MTWILALICSVVLAACSGVSKTATSTTGASTGAAASVSLSSIQVTPALVSVAAHSTQQFHATGVYSDGSTKDLTASATWGSTDSAVVSITAAGMATAGPSGSATVTAQSGGKTGSGTLSVNSASVNL